MRKLIIPLIIILFALVGLILIIAFELNILQKEDISYPGSSWIIAMATSFILILSWGFVFLSITLIRQNKISDIKSDFINNMTHEFKTPIATIQVAGEMLLNPNIHEYPYKVKKYAQVILDENNRIRSNVEQILQLSVMENMGSKIRVSQVSIHNILEQLAEQFMVSIHEYHGVIRLELNAESDLVMGDRVHLTNIYSNLIDNAVKYSQKEPYIIIASENKNGMIAVSIKDRGIGIRQREQKNVFKNLYRVSTGYIHDVKGFGIGLYYVKLMTEAHNGKITLQSEFHQGSTFTVYLPLMNSNENG
ncbi:MAG: HAMP domain-containing histidine kinase [Bacteroidetes bacterium]|nr:HAMP domain-containing histidine kinase [Bacteroidota bacterium]